MIRAPVLTRLQILLTIAVCLFAYSCYAFRSPGARYVLICPTELDPVKGPFTGRLPHLVSGSIAVVARIFWHWRAMKRITSVLTVTTGHV